MCVSLSQVVEVRRKVRENGSSIPVGNCPIFFLSILVNSLPENTEKYPVIFDLVRMKFLYIHLDPIYSPTCYISITSFLLTLINSQVKKSYENHIRSYKILHTIWNHKIHIVRSYEILHISYYKIFILSEYLYL